jgi:hypothetical protein
LPAKSEYKLDWCATIPNPTPTTTNIVPKYFGKVHNNCNVAKLVDDHPALFLFGDALTEFTLQIWGCKPDGVDTFGLIDGITELTAADAALLIDLYVEQTVLILQLGPTKEKQLHDALTCLAKSAITNPSTTEYSLSSCTQPDAGNDGSSSDGNSVDSAADGTDDASDPADAGSDADDSSIQDGGTE